jgi:hypothetical protein
MEPMGSTTSDHIQYPLDQMREVAATILAQADYDQFQHDQAWQQVVALIQNRFDPTLHEALFSLLKPYADRLRSSYDWQIDLATGLFNAVDLMDTSDQDIATSFTPKGSDNHLQ